MRQHPSGTEQQQRGTFKDTRVQRPVYLTRTEPTCVGSSLTTGVVGKAWHLLLCRVMACETVNQKRSQAQPQVMPNQSASGTLLRGPYLACRAWASQHRPKNCHASAQAHPRALQSHG
jgi:hypothetical protein